MKAIYVSSALSTQVYVFTLCSQIVFIGTDIAINEASQWSVLRQHDLALLVTFCIQDVLILMAAMVLGHSMFRTHVFKAGFVRILLHRFKFAIVFTLLYLALTISLQIVTLSVRWHQTMKYIWPPGFSVLFVTHRIVGVFYYYYYKRAALRLSDARYYDEEWVKHTFSH